MPALFENGVFGSNMPAWHGAGTVLPDDTFDFETAKRYVPELGMRIEACPIYAIGADGRPIRIDDFVANMRSDGAIVGVVGKDYKPVQGEEADAFITEVCQSGAAIVHTAGTLDSGRKMWIQCLAPEPFLVAGERSEEHRGFVTFVNSFDGSTKVGAITGTTRVVCWNTYNAAIASAPNSYWFKHTGDVMARVAEARQALKMGATYWKEMERIANAAIMRPFTDRQFMTVVDAVLPLSDDKGNEASGRKRINQERERDIVSKLWRESVTIANVSHTAWAAVNVFSEFSDHHIPSRETSRNSAAQNRLKRILFDRELKEVANARIYEMAGVK
jgi:phage/plasmid-like protein (TIGR03299 family)